MYILTFIDDVYVTTHKHTTVYMYNLDYVPYSIYDMHINKLL